MSLNNYPQKLIVKSIRLLKDEGFSVTWRKAKRKIKTVRRNKIIANTPLYTKDELECQKKIEFPIDIKFSILVPLYNTPEKFLRDMIQSVLDQTYGNWELCLADGSDAEHNDVGRISMEYVRKDSRVRYQKLERNMGISGNTNACIDMATGDYISLFDHDDLLHPAALFATMKEICEQNADFIYTDENTFHDTPRDAFSPHFKPDYAPDTLRANNYICHFTTFKRSLLDSVGKFRPECDGSQDFDMMLRLTEKAERIVHIPQILYYWRAHKGSVAEDIGAKPYVIDAAKRAVSDHLKRVGLKGEVLDSVVPSIYRLKYEIEGNPQVSILIPSYGHKEKMKRCLESIYKKSTYQNFEVIVIENNSKSQNMVGYYKEIQEKWGNLSVVKADHLLRFSDSISYGTQFAAGEHLLLLNDDTEVISPDWIQEMLMYSQRADVGAVGAKLYYPDDSVQHAGLGVESTVVKHLHRGFERQNPGYMGRLSYAQNLSAVAASCVMVRRSVWDESVKLNDFYSTEFNGIDLCMQLREAGYLVVWTPFAELYRYVPKKIGRSMRDNKTLYEKDFERLYSLWREKLAFPDPFCNIMMIE